MFDTSVMVTREIKLNLGQTMKFISHFFKYRNTEQTKYFISYKVLIQV